MCPAKHIMTSNGFCPRLDLVFWAFVLLFSSEYPLGVVNAGCPFWDLVVSFLVGVWFAPKSFGFRLYI